jgi:hypothetical protein
MVKVLVQNEGREADKMVEGAARKFLQRAIRACLKRVNPLTSLLLVSELNQSNHVGLACAGRASEIPEPAAQRPHKTMRGRAV